MSVELLDKLKAAHAGVGSLPLSQVRTSAWGRFLTIGLPTRKSEDYRYIRPNRLCSLPLSPAPEPTIDPRLIRKWVLPECEGRLLVFINGHFSEKLSQLDNMPDKLVVLPLEEAARPYGSYLKRRWAQTLNDEADPFTLLNAALHPGGAFVYVPPKTVCEDPIQVLHVGATVEKGAWAFPRLNLFAGAQSEVKLYARQVMLSGEDLWVHQSWDFALEEGAQVRLEQAAVDLDPSCWVMQGVRAQLKRDSRFSSVNFTEGATSVVEDYRVDLLESNASVCLSGGALLKQGREAHVNVLVRHLAPHCTSSQLFKNALMDHSRSSFKGKIWVDREAQKTDAFQLNNNLLLSSHARADTKPGLEIYADDVKASHGATVGQLSKDQLLYLRSRGCSEQMAQQLLVDGYLEELVARFSLSPLREELATRIADHLEG